jgi:hypothetical protein
MTRAQDLAALLQAAVKCILEGEDGEYKKLLYETRVKRAFASEDRMFRFLARFPGVRF